MTKLTLNGTTLAVLLAQDANSLVSTRQSLVQLDLGGFLGDKHYGMSHLSDGRTPQYPRGTPIRNNRQVSILSIEELAQVAAGMGVAELLPEWLGANLLLEGIPHLTQLPPNTRLYFAQGGVLVVQSENNPCIHPGKIIQNQFNREGLAAQFVSTALHRRGLVACVEKAGAITTGEAVRVEVPEQFIYSPDL